MHVFIINPKLNVCDLRTILYVSCLELWPLVLTMVSLLITWIWRRS